MVSVLEGFAVSSLYGKALFLKCRRFVPDVPTALFPMCRRSVPDVPIMIPIEGSFPMCR